MIAKCEFQLNLFYISIYSARSKVYTIERDMNVPYIVYMPFKTLVRSIERALYNARIASSSFPLYNFVVGFLVGLFFFCCLYTISITFTIDKNLHKTHRCCFVVFVVVVVVVVLVVVVVVVFALCG